MGAQASVIYKHCKRLAIRYNAENRAHKFLNKEKLSAAPRHPLPKQLSQDFTLSEEELKELHGKNENLNEYLKKVYLTSTSTVVGTPSKRPKPQKENEIFKKFMFFEPEKPKPGHCTLSNVVEILLNFHKDSDTWNASGIAMRYNLNKRDVAELLMYYSLFTVEKFKFMNAAPKDEEDEEPKKVEFEVFKQLEKKPYRQIEGKQKKSIAGAK